MIENLLIKKEAESFDPASLILCGELGIRTPGTFNSSTVFKTAAIDHSANSPEAKVQTPVKFATMIVYFFEY